MTNFNPAEQNGRGQEDISVLAVLLILLLVLLLGGLGFAIHVLWWIALAVLVIWLVGWAFGAGEAAVADVGMAAGDRDSIGIS